jgi:hypothetical protein
MCPLGLQGIRRSKVVSTIVLARSVRRPLDHITPHFQAGNLLVRLYSRFTISRLLAVGNFFDDCDSDKYQFA